MVRVAAALFCAALGMAAGYALWGIPARGLEEALGRLAFENDDLRTRLASDEISPAQAAIESVLIETRRSADVLATQSDALERLLDTRASGLEESLRECDTFQMRIQEQLETCLFAKAQLERTAAAAKASAAAAAAPRKGSQTVTETRVVPSATDAKALKEAIERSQKRDKDDDRDREESGDDDDDSPDDSRSRDEED